MLSRSFAVGRLKYYRNILGACLGNDGYLVFFKNDIMSGNILLIPFRI